MAAADRYRLFMSYGRKDAVQLALRLLQDLPAHGYEPWQDTRELRPGPSWEQQIEGAIQASKVFLALLSPHSVRRQKADRPVNPDAEAVQIDDSVCLDEIAFARYFERVPIVPAMVAPCRPPLSLSRLEYVDFVRWQEEQEYRKAFDRLLEGLALAIQGKPAVHRWVERLDPVDFSSFLAEKRRHFTGREWLFSRLTDRLDKTPQRALLIVGGAGIGKSAFIAELVHRNPQGRVVACHCCRSDVPHTLEPGRFVRSIAAMIASQIPQYAEEFETATVYDVLNPARSDADPQSALELGMINVLNRLDPPEAPRILVIDALDEALTADPIAGQRPFTIVDLLMNRVSRFPEWLKLVATTRNEAAVLNKLRSLQTEEIDAEDPGNLRDVADFVTSRLREPALADALGKSGRSFDDVHKTVVDNAKGNFLYARHALEALASSPGAFEALGTLPAGLYEQYEWFFERQFPTDEEFAPVKGVLESLVAAQAPLGIDDLALASELDAEEVLPRHLQVLSSYLGRNRVRGQYGLDHKSVGDWLTDEERAGSTFYVSRRAGHRRLAKALWSVYQEDVDHLSNYALAHFPDHLAVLTQKGSPADRLTATTQLANFALDPLVLKRQSDCPLDALRAISLSLGAAARSAGKAALPVLMRTALGLVAFRRDRLNPSRVFDLASHGYLDKVDHELDLFSLDTAWRDAALLTAIWIASDAHPEEARRMRERMTIATLTEPALIERVDAALEGRPAHLTKPIDDLVDEGETDAILAQIGGLDLERRSAYAETLNEPLAQPTHEEMVDAERGGDQAPVFMSEIQSPRLVAHVIQRPALWTASTDPVQEYIEVHAANAYRLYRNGSLYGILRAVLAHPDDAWARRTLQKLATAALAGGEPVFDESVPIVLDSWKGAAGDRASIDARVVAAADGVRDLSPERGNGDTWSHHKRRVAALMEALVIGGVAGIAKLPPLTPPSIPDGYAGPSAPGWLMVAESLYLAGRPWDEIRDALRRARLSAHNVQDATFCLRTTSHVNAMIDLWWETAGQLRAIDVRQVIPDFVNNPSSAKFAALHFRGWEYPGRRAGRESHPLPAWATQIDTVPQLVQAYQLPTSRIRELNPELASDTADLRPVTRLPDSAFRPLLAARLAAQALGDTTLEHDERTKLIQKLVPTATENPTALDTVLARLLIAAGPLDGPLIDELASIVRDAAPRRREPPPDPQLTARMYPH
jgi:hypothetical protein